MVYESAVLKEDLTILGPLAAALTVSTSGTDSDFVVKLVDVYPGDYPSSAHQVAKGVEMSGYQQLVRAEPFRGKYRCVSASILSPCPDNVIAVRPHGTAHPRVLLSKSTSNSFEHPEPFVPDRPSTVAFSLPDICHCFRAGHRVMVHVQSSWFPVVDRNPQTFCNIFTCGEEAFVPATQRLYSGSKIDILAL